MKCDMYVMYNAQFLAPKVSIPTPQVISKNHVYVKLQKYWMH